MSINYARIQNAVQAKDILELKNMIKCLLDTMLNTLIAFITKTL